MRARRAVASSLGGCTISVGLHPFEPEHRAAETYGRLDGRWCFDLADIDALEVCSAPFRARMTSFGFALPIVPRFDREPRFADGRRPA